MQTIFHVCPLTAHLYCAFGLIIPSTTVAPAFLSKKDDFEVNFAHFQYILVTFQDVNDKGIHLIAL